MIDVLWLEEWKRLTPAGSPEGAKLSSDPKGST
jgi:hypothetical protein